MVSKQESSWIYMGRYRYLHIVHIYMHIHLCKFLGSLNVYTDFYADAYISVFLINAYKKTTKDIHRPMVKSKSKLQDEG